ncbi:MAG: hypothetical protein ACYC1F_09420 [Gallionellaceae bacterium]
MKTYYLALLAILMLAACASPVHRLVKDDGASFVTGELVHDRGEGNLLVLEAPNRRYEARGFVVDRQTHLAELRKRYYGVNPKHWNRIFSGLDTDHVTYSVETIAKSADGQEVSCRIMWGGAAKPAGVCTDQAGAAFPVRFE